MNLENKINDRLELIKKLNLEMEADLRLLEKEENKNINLKEQVEDQLERTKNNIKNHKIINDDMNKDLIELNEKENKIKNNLKSNNYEKDIYDKLEKHLSKDSPIIEFYDKLKYRGANVIGLSFSSNK